MNKLLNSVFYFVWRLLNLKNYISYLLSTKTEVNRKSSYTGFLPEIKNVSKKINAELMANHEFLNHVEEAKKSTDITSYMIDCIPYLSIEVKNDILNIAQKNRFILTLAQNFLGIQPTLNTISIYATVPSINDKEIGSKKWHRDLDTFLAADFMFAITNINDENGPFFYIKPDDFGSNRYFNPKEHFGWESGGRFTTEELIEYGLNPEMVNKFDGKSGNYTMLNTGEAFHKGGLCKSEMRILGRFIYSSFGYSNGNLNEYGCVQGNLKKAALNLSLTLYSLHEKIYRNLLKRL